LIIAKEKWLSRKKCIHIIIREMKARPKEPPMPVERYDTIRKYMIALLEEQTMSARDISAAIRISEKEVYEHLEHIRKTLNKDNAHLKVEPAQCEKCGFSFTKRGRLKKPGKCPLCRSSLILPPLFSIKSRRVDQLIS
jgi:predicted Zn-ribbon and HTH transcriptional regulator